MNTNNTVKDRILAMMEVALEGAKINAAFLPTIRTLAKNFLRDVSEADLRAGVAILRDRYIPWLLGDVLEAGENENTPP